MKALSIIFSCILIFTGCTKENLLEEQEVPAKQATIDYMGNPAADGLGWVLRFADQSYEIPTNLGENFQSDELNVKVAYKRSAKTFPCRCTEPKYMVDIISIERISETGDK
ncbi:MAG TPA: hypothetical protein VF622_04815 [Segetibacter sp.]|jgi:hypothetical protein